MIALVVLALALVLFGLGFAVHLLWIIAVIAAVLWVAGYAFRSGEGAHWYRW
jgi:hypothetical protein